MITLTEWLKNPPKQVVKYPESILRNTTYLVLSFNDELKRVVDTMFSLMYTFGGVGISGPQVGLPYKIFVINQTGDWQNKSEEKVFINPEVISYGLRKNHSQEACLSLPGITGTIERSRRFLFSAHNIKGKVEKYAYESRLSRIVQHEIHHLDGILIIDKMSKTELKKFDETLKKMELPF